MNNSEVHEYLSKFKYSDLVNLTCSFCMSPIQIRKRDAIQQLRYRGRLSCSSGCARTHSKCVIVSCAQCKKPVKRSLKYKSKHSFCSRSCSAIFNNKLKDYSWITPEFKQKLSIKMKNIPPAGFRLNPKLYGSKGGRCSKRKLPRIESICQNKSCNKIFEHISTTKRVYCCRACADQNRYHPNSTIVHRSTYKDQQMDSGAELIFAKLLDTVNIKWIKNQTQYFSFIGLNGKQKRYYPDFFLPDHNLWIEIKGKRYIRPDDELRRAAVGNIVLIMASELRNSSAVLSKITQIRQAGSA